MFNLNTTWTLPKSTVSIQCLPLLLLTPKGLKIISTVFNKITNYHCHLEYLPAFCLVLSCDKVLQNDSKDNKYGNHTWQRHIPLTSALCHNCHNIFFLSTRVRFYILSLFHLSAFPVFRTLYGYCIDTYNFPTVRPLAHTIFMFFCASFSYSC